MTAAVLAAVPALPVVPTLPSGGCPTVAGALGAAGLGPVCQLAGGAAGAVGGVAGSVAGGVAGSAVSGLAGAGVDSVLNGLGGWVSSGASWLLGQIGAVIGATTTVDLGASWFGAHYKTMAALAGTVVLPLLLLGVMQAVYRQSASMLLRTVLVHLPLSILLTAVAVKLVQLGLALTDAMSASVASGSGLDAGHFMGTVSQALTGAPAAGAAAGSPGAPAFVLFLGALAVVFGAVLVWIELLLRAAAVYVAVLFLPLALASLAWPAIAHWCRRLVDTLVALVLGKFVIVSVLSLAAGALAGGTGSVPSGARPGAGGSGGSGAVGAVAAPGGGGFGSVLGGAALLLLAAFAPWALFRLLPFMEAGAVAHLEALSHRAGRTATEPVQGLARLAIRASGVGAGAGGSELVAGAIAGAAGGPAGAAGAAVGAGRTGGTVGALAGGVGSGDPSDETPDRGLSSVETTGVGSTEAPASSIPMWEPNERATAAARYYSEGGTGSFDGIVLPELHYPDETEPPSLEDDRAGHARDRAPMDAPVLLPRATGTDKQHWLVNDEFGPKLIAGPDPTARRRPPPDGDG